MPPSHSRAAPKSAPAQRKLSTSTAATAQRDAPGETLDPWHAVFGPTSELAPADTPAVQRKTEGAAPGSESLPADSSGSAMPSPVQAKMEGAFGADFSSVKIHEGPQSTALGARAYTQGSDIHFAPGQYQPESQGGQELLGHELAHVVQQSQGRVGATTQAKGLGVNDDSALEHEADQMGVRAARGESAGGSAAGAGPIAAGVMQCKVVQLASNQETHFGTYKPENYGKNASETKLHAAIKFDPNQKVNATKIGFTQVIRKNVEGADLVIDPAARNRMVTEGTGEGFRVDRLSSRDNPIYGASNLGDGNGLDQTGESNNTTASPTELNPDLGRNATYDLGHRYMDGDAEHVKEAGMYDGPTITKDKERTVEFESTALAIEGEMAGTYLGSVKWGYTVDNAASVSEIEFAKVSDGTPSANFMAAAQAWNETTARGSYEAITDGVAVLKLTDVSTNECTLASGDRVTQTSTVTIGGVAHIGVDVTSGTNAGKSGYVLVSQLRDVGDGAATVDLPIDQVFLVASATTLRESETGTNMDLAEGSRLILKGWNSFMGNYVEVEVGDGEHTGKRGTVYQGNLVDELTRANSPLGPGVPETAGDTAIA